MYQNIIYACDSLCDYGCEIKSLLQQILDCFLATPILRHPGTSEWKEAAYLILWLLYNSMLSIDEAEVKKGTSPLTLFIEEYGLFASFEDVYRENPPLTYFQLIERMSMLIIEWLKTEVNPAQFARLAGLYPSLLSTLAASEDRQAAQLRKNKAEALGNYILRLHLSNTEYSISYAKELYVNDIRLKRKGMLFKSLKDPILEAQLMSLSNLA